MFVSFCILFDLCNSGVSTHSLQLHYYLFWFVFIVLIQTPLVTNQKVLPISWACAGATLLGLRMNWHWVSGGRHWSSSSTSGQSAGLVGSLPSLPPSPTLLLPPSRMWLILMLKGNSWPEWKVRVQRLEVKGLVCAVFTFHMEPKQKSD